MLNDPVWKKVLEVEEVEVDAEIAGLTFNLMELLNMSEKQVFKQFQVLNNYMATEPNNLRQRIALFEMIIAIEKLKSKKKQKKQKNKKNKK